MYSNPANIPLSLAVWLATDEYDAGTQPNYISVTTLLKSIRQIVLSKRAETASQGCEVDIATQVASSMGTALHTAVERAWMNPDKALDALGYPKRVRDAIRINPSDDELSDDIIPVYQEQRVEKEYLGWIIGGKYDMILDGSIRDIKSTSTYTYMNKSNDDKFRMQGSIYRWLNPTKVVHDTMYIDYIFTDWSAKSANMNPAYPKSRVMEYPIEMASITETERYIASKLRAIDSHMDSPEDLIPECSPDELWRADPVYKYYKDPEKRARSTANFDNLAAANKRLAEEGKGIVVVVFGAVRACRYCTAAPICSQRKRLAESGEFNPNE